MSARIVTVTPNPVLDRTLTVPVLELNTVLRANDVRTDIGGKGFNVSRALKALGMESLCMGFIGGATGQRLEDGLHELGIATDFVHIGGETRTNIVITDPFGGQHVKVNEAGPVVSASEQAAFFARAEAQVQPADLWVMAGTLPRNVASDFYAQLIQTVQSRGGRAVLDASGDALHDGLSAAPFLAKPNTSEAAEIVGRPILSISDAQVAIQTFLEFGVQIVVLSMGAGGIVVGNGSEIFHVAAPPIHAYNTVGAGDALVAGMVWALAQELPLHDAARWGVATGSAAAARPGVDFAPAADVADLVRTLPPGIHSLHLG